LLKPYAALKALHGAFKAALGAPAYQAQRPITHSLIEVALHGSRFQGQCGALVFYQ
jgi:hypothetical protein